MQLLSIIPTLTFIALALADPNRAPRSQDSPQGVVYTAHFDNVVYGYVKFYTSDYYVKASVNIANLPEWRGPFTYQIHQRAVPYYGDCYATYGTFDPYHGYPNAPSWEYADVGDLSGKHGLMTGPKFTDDYFDPYLSLNPFNRAFFGHLSVVIRDCNGQRIACANIGQLQLDANELSALQKQGPQTPPQVDEEKSKLVDVDVTKQLDVDKQHGLDVDYDKKVDVDKTKRSNVDVDSGIDVDVDKKVDMDKKRDVNLPFAAGKAHV